MITDTEIEMLLICLTIVGIAVADFVIITHYIKRMMELVTKLTRVMERKL